MNEKSFVVAESLGDRSERVVEVLKDILAPGIFTRQSKILEVLVTFEMARNRRGDVHDGLDLILFQEIVIGGILSVAQVETGQNLRDLIGLNVDRLVGRGFRRLGDVRHTDMAERRIVLKELFERREKDQDVLVRIVSLDLIEDALHRGGEWRDDGSVGTAARTTARIVVEDDRRTLN